MSSSTIGAPSTIRGILQVTSVPVSFEIQHYNGGSAINSTGLGFASVESGEEEVFSRIYLLKIN